MGDYASQPPFFNAEHLPSPQNAYVVWLDVMGVRAIMSRSLPITANFVFKLHVTVLEAQHPTDITLYPVMDGVFVVSCNQKSLIEFLKTVFSRLAETFVSEPDIHHRFIVKAAVAYGPVVHGRFLPPDASYTLANQANLLYRDSILLGIPMIQAVKSEPSAPPFGIYIHESARAFAPDNDEPFHHVWWSWISPELREMAIELRKKLDEYFEWCKSRSGMIEYNRDRIEVHKIMSNEYFVDSVIAPGNS